MLFFVTGGNGAGKSSCIPSLARLLPDFAIHDFADLGVPQNPDAIWRQETTGVVGTNLHREASGEGSARHHLR